MAMTERGGTATSLTDLHGYDGARDKFSVVPDGKVPGSYPHQVVEVEFHNEAAFRVHLEELLLHNMIT